MTYKYIYQSKELLKVGLSWVNLVRVSIKSSHLNIRFTKTAHHIHIITYNINYVQFIKLQYDLLS